MKITCLLGSPRPNGNTTQLAKGFCEAAQSLGARIEIFALNKLHYRGCQSCMACKTRLDRCLLQDDLTQVLDSVREADILVLATPTYYGDVSSQIKAFIDRTYSYFVPDFHTNPKPSRLAPGKKLVFIQVQGQPDETKYDDIFPRYEAFFRRYGFAENALIRICGLRNAGEVEKRGEDLMKAEELAKRIMGR